MPSLGTVESVSCFRPWLAAPRHPPLRRPSLFKSSSWDFSSLWSFPLLLWFSAKLNSWLYLDLYFLLRCFPDVWSCQGGHDCIFCVLITHVTGYSDQWPVLCLFTFQVVVTNLTLFGQSRHKFQYSVCVYIKAASPLTFDPGEIITCCWKTPRVQLSDWNVALLKC